MGNNICLHLQYLWQIHNFEVALIFFLCNLSYHCGVSVLVLLAVGDEIYWEGGVDAEEKMFFKGLSLMR